MDLQSIAQRARTEAQNNQMVDQNYTEAGKLLNQFAALLDALTPSPDTKTAFLGEFTFKSPNGRMDYSVPWTTVKEIMTAIAKKAGL
jgi:hypothetical protein